MEKFILALSKTLYILKATDEGLLYWQICIPIGLLKKSNRLDENFFQNSHVLELTLVNMETKNKQVFIVTHKRENYCICNKPEIRVMCNGFPWNWESEDYAKENHPACVILV